MASKDDLAISQMGGRGGQFVNSTSEVTGVFNGGFYPIGECVINTMTQPGMSASAITGLTTSVWIPGQITALTLTSGSGYLLK